MRLSPRCFDFAQHDKRRNQIGRGCPAVSSLRALRGNLRGRNENNKDNLQHQKEYIKMDDNQQCTACCSCCSHQKHTPRSEAQLKSLNSRLNRIIGQLGGIKNMLEDNRYCGDILIQLSAVQSALESFGYEILGEHLKTCVVENVQSGNTQILDEALALIKKLK